MEQHTGELDAATLGRVARALGVLKAAPQPLLASLEHQACAVLGSMDIAGLGSCLGGFAALGHRPADSLLAGSEAQLVSLLPAADAQHICTVLQAYVDSQHSPSGATLAAVAKHLTPNLQLLQLPSLTSLVWALVAFRYIELPLLGAVAQRAHAACELGLTSCRRMGHSPRRPFDATSNSISAPRELVR